MFSLFKRFRELIVVGVLLVYPFGTFLARGNAARIPNIVDRAVIAATSPLQGALTWTFDGLASGWHGYLALRQVRTENLALRQANQELLGKLNALSETRDENARFRALLAYAEDKPGPMVVARILGVSPVATSQWVRIDKGENDGVRRGMAVVTAEGVVGQVLRATGGYADVLLITDGNSRVGVRVQRSRARGTASGTGGVEPLRLDAEGSLKLENVLTSDDLANDDLLITSGTDGIFPPGLVVGRAAAVRREKSDLFQRAQIIPAVNFAKLEEVGVLSSPGGVGGSAPPAIAPPLGGVP